MTAAHCPPLGDWSLPSNHAVIATGLALALPRAWRWALATVSVVLVARVAAGVHYPHDVLTGALLAVLFVAAAVALLDTPVRHLTTAVLTNPLVARLLGRTSRVP